jgi:hypothetical protein
MFKIEVLYIRRLEKYDNGAFRTDDTDGMLLANTGDPMALHHKDNNHKGAHIAPIFKESEETGSILHQPVQ